MPKQPGHVQGETNIPKRVESNRSVEKAQQSTRPKQVKMSRSTKKRKETKVENEAPIPTRKAKPESGPFEDKIQSKILPRSSETEQHLPKLQPGHVQGETNIPKRVESNRSVEKTQQSTRPKQVKMSRSTKKQKETGGK